MGVSRRLLQPEASSRSEQLMANGPMVSSSTQIEPRRTYDGCSELCPLIWTLFCIGEHNRLVVSADACQSDTKRTTNESFPFVRALKIEANVRSNVSSVHCPSQA